MLIYQLKILSLQGLESCQLLHPLAVPDCVSLLVSLGSWKTAFQPEETSTQEFHVDETTTVMAPLMTHTGRYHYLNDKVNKKCLMPNVSLFVYFSSTRICSCSPWNVLWWWAGSLRLLMMSYFFLTVKVRRCTVVKLSLSKRSYMLLVLPHEGANLHDIESKLGTAVMSDWHQNLQEGWVLSFLKTLNPNHAPVVDKTW